MPTCHWCHVMERESFEDEDVAAILNEHYVSIKVDREERPDIDHLYMTVCQAMTGQGGWPLTIVMTPDRKPFFAGTYYPKHRRYGRYGLMDLLPSLAEKWKEDPERIVRIGDEIVKEVRGRSLSALSGELTDELADQAVEQYLSRNDEVYGGFGGAPKFPTPHNLLFLMRQYHRTKDAKILEAVERTLEAMYRGGLYDHIGFGFARYSTDERWLVPHFEKMLYDNALLAYAYLEAHQLTGKPLYRSVAEGIFAYVKREMTHPEGGFYSAEDADSEGVEGKFYVWTPDEIEDVLGAEDAVLAMRAWDITAEGNFEGRSIPNLIEFDRAALAAEFGLSELELAEKLDAIREKLFRARERRVHPHKDDKILTAWNGLMIAAFAKGGAVLGDAELVGRAELAAAFVADRLTRPNGRLLVRYRDGEAAVPGFIDDYAFMLWGLTELIEATGSARWYDWAVRLADDMLRLFRDENDGGFFFSGTDAEELLYRNKETYDGATPSGNGVAAWILARLGRMSGRTEWAEAAEQVTRAFAGAYRRYPTGHAMGLMAVDYMRHPGPEIVCAYGRPDPESEAIGDALRHLYSPNAIRLSFPASGPESDIRDRLPWLADKRPLDGRTTVYVCRDFACMAPARDAGMLREQLR
ncbi:thioredoxin domain-containing protein [Paenibacillus thermoaerophilus]|nr:thioredoxin domain-containing protein [Paenibacillus thermoaerophilus]